MASIICLPPKYTSMSAQVLGAGTFGKVMALTNKDTGETLAVKIYKTSPDSSFISAAMSEVAVLLELSIKDNDGFIVKLHDFDILHRRCFIAMELLQGDIYGWIKKHHPNGVPPPAMKVISIRLFSALSFLRRESIVHGDIKPDNFLMASENPDSIKLCDFNIARRLCHPVRKEIFPDTVGCVAYSSPEVILGYPSDCATDMFSMGCSLFEIFTNKVLFSSRSQVQHLNNITRLLGMPSNQLLEQGVRTGKFFSRTGDTYSPRFLHGCVRCCQSAHVTLLSRIASCLLVRHTSYVDISSFRDLILDVVTFNPGQRLTPNLALFHQFLH